MRLPTLLADSTGSVTDAMDRESDEPVDPDLDADDRAPARRSGAPARSLRWPHRRRRSRRHRDVLAAVGAGGALGALARYGIELAFPVTTTEFPWPTLAMNLGGSLLLGVVLFIVFERRPPNRLLRPFLAIGLLGGFTTFSTFAVEVVQRADTRPAIAATYLLASLVGGPTAVIVGGAVTRRIFARPLDRSPRGTTE